MLMSFEVTSFTQRLIFYLQPNTICAYSLQVEKIHLLNDTPPRNRFHSLGWHKIKVVTTDASHGREQMCAIYDLVVPKTRDTAEVGFIKNSGV